MVCCLHCLRELACSSHCATHWSRADPSSTSLVLCSLPNASFSITAGVRRDVFELGGLGLLVVLQFRCKCMRMKVCMTVVRCGCARACARAQRGKPSKRCSSAFGRSETLRYSYRVRGSIHLTNKYIVCGCTLGVCTSVCVQRMVSNE